MRLPLLLLFALSASRVEAQSARLTWDPNTEVDLAGYVVQTAASPSGPYHDTLTTTETTAQVDGLARGTPYYFVIRALDTRGLESAPSNEVTVTLPGQPPDDCAPVTGRYAVSVFPTSLLRTGSGGPSSKTRFDFQVASPGAPVTAIGVYADGAQIASMAGTDLTALAGMWFPMPASGTYTLTITATNARGCTKTATYGLGLVVP